MRSPTTFSSSKTSKWRLSLLILAVTLFISYLYCNGACEFRICPRVGGGSRPKPALLPSWLLPEKPYDAKRLALPTTVSKGVLSLQPTKEKMKTALAKPDNTGPKQPRCFRLLLIVIFNGSGHYRNVGFLKQLYGTAFDHMVFDGPLPVPPGGEVVGSKSDILYGSMQHMTVLQAIGENPNYDGYLWIGDDVWLNFPQLLSTMDFNKIWLNAKNLTYFLDDKKPNPGPKTQKLFQWANRIAMPNVRKTYHRMPEKFRNRTEYAFGSPEAVVQSFSDVVYVPRRFVADFKTIAEAMEQVIFEIVVPTALNLASRKEDIQYFSDALYLWYGGERERLHEFWSDNRSFIHAVKWSNITKQNMAKKWMAQCIKHYNYARVNKRIC